MAIKQTIVNELDSSPSYGSDAEDSTKMIHENWSALDWVGLYCSLGILKRESVRYRQRCRALTNRDAMTRVGVFPRGSFRGERTWVLPRATQSQVKVPVGRLGDQTASRRCRATSKDDTALMEIYFVESDILTHAKPGSLLCEVAEDAGVHVSLGCGSGQCGMCEMEVKKYSTHDAEDSVGVVVRTCVTPVPKCTDYKRLEVSEFVDPIWGYNG